MRFDRLVLASAACVLVAGTASAQTNTTTTSTRTSTGDAAGAQSSTTSTTVTSTQGSAPASATGGDTTAAAAGAAFQPITATPGADLLTVLQSSGQFTTLLKAIAATNLTSVFQRPGQLTLFAPTDAAFAALPAGQLATLMQTANLTQLQQLVLLHAVNTPIRSSELLGHSATNEPTVATGKSVHLDGSSGTVKVDDASVVQGDVKTSNGAIFVIDKVLSPAYVPAAVTTTTTEKTTEKTTATKRRKR